MAEIFEAITTWYMAHINYGTVFILMSIESSFIPFPSEIVIPPAAYKAAQGDLNIYGVVASGTAGALVGALFNYYIALILGRKIIHKLSRTRLANLMLINEHSVDKAENYFNKHGKSSTLIGRLIPAIRQLISLPAGLSRMKLKDFILFTIIGSCIWNIILAILGYFLYSQKELLQKNYHILSMAMVVIGIVFIVFLTIKYFKSRSLNNCESSNL